MAFAPNGDLYIGGDFTNVGGIAAADYIVKWNGITYSALGATPLNGVVRAISIADDGTVYIGGSFTNAGGDANADYICKWNGTAFSSLNSTPLTGGVTQVNALDIDRIKNILYIGGDFLNAGGNANADYICSFNGTVFDALGSGVNNVVYSIKVAPDNVVYVSGAFSSAGGIAQTDRQAKFNGYAWSALDLILSSSGTILVFEVGNVDSVVNSIYDLFIGFDDVGVTGQYGGLVTVVNDGNALAFPQIVFKRTGGTAITLKILRNENTGKELLFDNYNLLDGEKLTIDLTPTKKSITSNYFGSRFNAIFANSDFGTWTLKPGSNSIACFATDSFVIYPSSLDAYLLWKDKYKSYN